MQPTSARARIDGDVDHLVENMGAAHDPMPDEVLRRRTCGDATRA